jgi:hypothetical protein
MDSDLTIIIDQQQQRISKLEMQVESLKKAVKQLADALQEELLSYDHRLSTIDSQTEEIARVQLTHAKVLKKQEERLKRGFAIMADALSALNPPSLSSSIGGSNVNEIHILQQPRIDEF